jgi:branched-chain amino acid transport system permease protein
MDWGAILESALRAGIGINAAVYALAAIGINVQFGYTGLMNFGQVGFVLVGAYGTAISVDKWGLPLPLAFLVGVLAAVVLGLILGLPTLRLRADYLAIVTISASEILRIAANSRSSKSLTNSSQGIKAFANPFYRWNPFSPGRYGIGGVSFSHRDLWAIVVTWGLVAIVSVLTYLLVRSPWGRVVRSIREDEDAARALGKNVFGYKIQSLVIGGVFGGLAGIMLAVDRQFVEPAAFQSALTFFAYAALILGGLARIFGPIVGAVIFWFVIEGVQSFLRQAIESGFMGFDRILDPSDVGAVRFMLVGLVIMLLVIFRPQGILGSRDDAVLDE